MAQGNQQGRTIEELRQEIAHSRDRLARDLSGLRYELDFPLKFRKSFQRHSGVWVSAATLFGALFTLRPLRRRKVIQLKAGRTAEIEEKKGIFAAGLAMGAMRLIATLLRPFVVQFVTQKLGNYSRRR